MTRFVNAERRDRNILLSTPIILIVLLSFLSIFIPEIPQAHATSLTFTKITSGEGETGSSFTLSPVFNPHTDCNGSCLGLAVAISIYELPVTASLTSIVDYANSDCGRSANNWAKIARTVSVGSGDKTPFAIEQWWTLVTCASNNTYWNFQFNFAASCNVCAVAIYYSNMPVSYSNQVGSNYLTVSNNALSSITIPFLNGQVSSQKFTFGQGANYIVFNSAQINQSGTCQCTSAIPNSPLSGIGMFGDNPDGIAVYQDSQAIISANGSVVIQQFSTQFSTNSRTGNPEYGCGFLKTLACTTYQMVMLTSVFITGQIQPPSCQNCGIVGGGTTKGTVGVTLFTHSMPNETILYTADSPVGGVLIANITSEAKEYNNTGTGKNLDFIYTCIYELPSGVLSSAHPISSTNPLKQVWCSLNNQISNGQTNQMIHAYPNIEVPPLTTYAVTLMSRFAGLYLYSTTDNIIMYSDTQDYTGTSGTPPLSLINFVSSTPPVWLNWIGSQSSVMTTSTLTSTSTYTCLSGSSCVTSTTTIYVTQVSTSLIYSLSGTAGAVANIQDITLFLPVWVLPLIMGALFGVVGLLFGGVVGVAMGVILGVVPLWFAFLLGLGIVFLLFKRVL